MQERERRRSNASTIGGKRRVKSIRDGYAEAIVLDFVQALAAGRQCCGFCRKARRDEHAPSFQRPWICSPAKG